MNEYSSFARVYKDMLETIFYNPEYQTTPRGLEIKECLNYSFTLNDPGWSLYYNNIRSSQYKYIAREFVWYLAGDCSPEWIGKFAKIWNNITNPNGYINSNYGYLLFHETKNCPYGHQWMWAKNMLKMDKDSRQAIIHFNKPWHQFEGVKDFPCTIYGIFHIRDDELHFSVFMRSSDAILGIPTDVAFFTILQQMMLYELKEFYPDLEMGQYNHLSNSVHIYERDFKLVQDMLLFDFESEDLPKVDTSFFVETTPGRITLTKDVFRLGDYVYNNKKEYTSDSVFLQNIYNMIMGIVPV